MKVNPHKLVRLEDSVGSYSGLLTLKTSKKKEMLSILNADLADWMKNNLFLEFKTKLLDIAIIMHLDDLRMRIQDIDNIAKNILDALKNTKDANSYLFEDDSQVIRLLIEKRKKIDIGSCETNTYTISFREHNSKKQMLLMETYEI